MSESAKTAGAQPGRVTLGDAIVLGLCSSGPAQTLAVSLAAMVAACRYGGVVPVLACFVPMLGIAVGYHRLNRWEPSAGATYTWVARVFHPYLGFLAGWMILLYYTLGTSSLTMPAGTYTLELFAPRLVTNHLAVALTGGAWNIVVTALALGGLKIAARFEWIVVVFQYVAILALAAVGAVAVFQHGTFSWHSLSIDGMGGLRGLMSGMLIACFMYSGWDAAIYVNEESVDKVDGPGLAAIASVVILALFYSIALFGLQTVLDPLELQNHAGDALAVIATRLLPGPWGMVMSLVVLSGTLATLQAAVIAAARVSFAMSRDGVMPKAFRRVDPRTGNPWVATVVMSVINLCLLVLALTTNSLATALANVVSSLGLISLLFYALTGAAAVWQNRDRIGRSAADFLLGGLLPGLGTVFMAWIAIESVRTGATSRAVLAWGAGSIALGAIAAVFVRYCGNAIFFQPKSAFAVVNTAVSREHSP
jgi:amino acid transporter